MSRYRRLYTLYPETPQRPGDPSYWYFYVYNTENKRVRRSTGIINDGTETSYAQADAVVHALIGANEIKPIGQRMKFRDYAEDFWDWEKSDYVKDRLSHDPKAFGKPYIYHMRLNCTKYIVPVLGDYYLDEITTKQIDALATGLLKTLASQTVYHVMNSLKTMLSEAKRNNLIRLNPMLEAIPVTVRNEERDPFTVTEAAALLDKSTIAYVFGAGPIDKPHPYKGHNPWMHWLANALGATMGRRVSEVISLRAEDFNFEESYIWVRRSQDSLSDMKEGTKTTPKGSRIPIDTDVMKTLKPYIPATGWVFRGHKKETPMVRKSIEVMLEKAMRRIGITEEEQKNRNLGFDSWRHFFVTRARADKLSDALIGAVTEHDTKKSIDRYMSLSLDDKRAISSIQKEIFNGKA